MEHGRAITEEELEYEQEISRLATLAGERLDRIEELERQREILRQWIAKAAQMAGQQYRSYPSTQWYNREDAPLNSAWKWLDERCHQALADTE